MDQIKYVTGVVGQFGTDVGMKAGALQEIHSDVQSKTTALSEFFAGAGADGFFEAQAQMLSGLQGLIETVSQHGATTCRVNDNAIATDSAISGLF